MENRDLNKHFFLIFSFLLLLPVIIWGQDLFDQGEEAFLNNDPESALIYLEPLAEQGSSDNRVYMYLGIAMQQLGRYQGAVDIFKKGIEHGLPPFDSLYFNMGNNYFIQGQDDAAERAYSKAIEQNGQMAGAFLNRANTRIRSAKYINAVSDYQLYLKLDADSPQRDVIEALISKVQAYLAEEERIRQEEEVRRAVEAERQRALLASVLSSLENAEDDTVNMRAESEDIESFDMELDIED